MKNLFFPGAPLAQISPTLKRVMRTTTDLRNFIKRSLLGFDLIIGQGNRPDRLHSQLVEWGILPPFDIFFTGSRAGAEQIAQHWVEREVEEALEEQTPYIWDSPGMWQKFWEFLEGHNKKRILLISSAPRGQHERIAEFQNILFPVIDSGQLYVYMPFSGHPASAKAIAAMKKKPQPLSLTWHVVENTILTQWFPTKQAAAHFFDSLQKNEDFNIINLDEAKAQFKAMKMIRNTPTK
jgi:hypothetical protein